MSFQRLATAIFFGFLLTHVPAAGPVLAQDAGQPDAAPAPAPDPNAPPDAKAPPGEAPVAPNAPEIRGDLLKDLYTHLAKSSDPDTAAALAGQIERLWFISGSDTIDLLMQRSVAAMAANNFDLALKLLTAVVELQPDFAEGWNRRAYVYHRLEDDERSLGDLRRVLALEPKHYKALEGLANILHQSGSKKLALEAMRKLLEIHPFLPGVKEAVKELSREVEGQGI